MVFLMNIHIPIREGHKFAQRGSGFRIEPRLADAE